MTLPQKNSPRIKTPYPYLMNLVSNYLEKNIQYSKYQWYLIKNVVEITDQNRCILFGPPRITVPRNGHIHKKTFRDKNIEEICPFPHRRRGMFYFKNDTFYLEKRGTFWVWKFWESKRPPAPWFNRPWLCPFRGNEKGSRGQFSGSAVAIRAQMSGTGLTLF